VISPLSELNFEKPTPFRPTRKTLLADARRYFDGCGRGATESGAEQGRKRLVGSGARKNPTARPGFFASIPAKAAHQYLEMTGTGA
jgi:hypothetical protein